MVLDIDVRFGFDVLNFVNTGLEFSVLEDRKGRRGVRHFCRRGCGCGGW